MLDFLLGLFVYSDNLLGSSHFKGKSKAELGLFIFYYLGNLVFLSVFLYMEIGTILICLNPGELSGTAVLVVGVFLLFVAYFGKNVLGYTSQIIASLKATHRH